MLSKCFQRTFNPLFQPLFTLNYKMLPFATGWPFKSSFVALCRQLNKLLRVISLTFVTGISYIAVAVTKGLAQIEWNNSPQAFSSR